MIIYDNVHISTEFHENRTIIGTWTHDIHEITLFPINTKDGYRVDHLSPAVSLPFDIESWVSIIFAHETMHGVLYEMLLDGLPGWTQETNENIINVLVERK